MKNLLQQQEREFDEKFNNINKTLVSIETFEGFNEQKPAVEDVKSIILSQKIELLEKVVEEIAKKITEGIGYGKFGFTIEGGKNDGKIAINLDDILSTLQETIKEMK